MLSQVFADDTVFIFCVYITSLFILEADFQNTSHVGKLISTKKVGENEREDITHLYKYRENTQNERKAFETAYSFGKGPQTFSGLLNFEEEGRDLTIGMYSITFMNYINKIRCFHYDCHSGVSNCSYASLHVDGICYNIYGDLYI